MEEPSSLWGQIINNKLTASILVAATILMIYLVGYKLFLKKHLPRKTNSVVERRGQTYWKMIMSLFRYTLAIILLLVVLKINGVNVDSLLAGLGVAGVVAGLAVQDALKDIIRGFGLVTDAYFSVGDVIKHGDDECKVLSIGMKTTKLQSTITGNVVSIANRNLEEAEIIKDHVFVTLPTPYELSLAKAEELMNTIAEKAAEQEKITACSYLGVKQLGESSIDHLLRVQCRADQRTVATRKVLKIALAEYAKARVAIPYEQLDVHIEK